MTYTGSITTTILDATLPTDPETPTYPPEQPDTAYTLQLFAVEYDGDAPVYTNVNTISEPGGEEVDITANYVVLAVD